MIFYFLGKRYVPLCSGNTDIYFGDGCLSASHKYQSKGTFKHFPFLWGSPKPHWLHFFDFSPLCIFKCDIFFRDRCDQHPMNINGKHIEVFPAFWSAIDSARRDQRNHIFFFWTLLKKHWHSIEKRMDGWIFYQIVKFCHKPRIGLIEMKGVWYWKKTFSFPTNLTKHDIT